MSSVSSDQIPAFLARSRIETPKTPGKASGNSVRTLTAKLIGGLKAQNDLTGKTYPHVFCPGLLWQGIQRIQRFMPTSFDIRNFGTVGEPLVIIDDFSDQADALFETACAQSYQRRGPHYPGLRAPADPAYLADRMDILTTALREVFGLSKGAALVECAFSIVTTPPAELTPIQRIPHFDTTDPGRIALLHYLCDSTCGGTAFYRHRETGFEVINADCLSTYDAALKSQSDALPSQGYVDGDTPLFQETGRIAAVYNRMVIYRGHRLHSGVIPQNLVLSPDPRQGRLTINTFLQGR